MKALVSQRAKLSQFLLDVHKTLMSLKFKSTDGKEAEIMAESSGLFNTAERNSITA